jgi:4-hydroxythreonine-4-phosphate dehydrogenase
MRMIDMPVVAITMGDAAGIGAEITVATIANPEMYSLCRPFVVGDAMRLSRAAEIMNLELEIRSISDPEGADFNPKVLNVVDLGLIPEDLPFGELSAIAGDAAYEYLRVACDMAMGRTVQAICTAPLNKEALKLAGHNFPGHTELLAHFTNTDEVSMMLTTDRLRVIHVTTHIGIIDAVAKIEPGLVQRTIIRGYEALVRAGIKHPKIGVCAINPHAGEGGMFGYGEEESKILPGVKAAQAKGIDVEGPLPADTLFFLAGRGDYDLVVAMYHDQGHGPVKVLGIETGVNISVGLPVIRTSVDHGTAFGIAGTGTARPESMYEALRQAARLAGNT